MPGLALVGAARQELALARDIRARELVAGTPPQGVAAAIVAHCGPVCGTTRIRAHRLALGIALADVVAQVRAWYEAEGRRPPRFSETLLSAYESGQKRPGPEYLHYLCAAYRADPPDLGYEGPCLCGRSHSPATSPSPAEPPASPSLTSPSLTAADPAVPADADSGPSRASGDAEDDELRGMMLRLMSEAGTQVDCRFLGAVDQMRRRMDGALLGGTVSAAMIDQWEETTAGYGRRYMTIPPLRLLCDALLDFGDVRRMCEERQPLEFSERLCRLAGQLAGLAGIVLLDLGDQRLARSFFRTARTAADETGDRRLRAWVAVREALVPLYYGDPREAASLASAAIDLAGRAPCVAGAMAPVVVARAQARLARLARDGDQQSSAHQSGGRGLRGALDQVRAALDRSHDVLSDLPEEETSDTAFGYTERQFFFHTGDTLAMLGDHQEAQRAFSRALRLYPAAEVLDSALVAIGQAQCLADADEPQQALRLGREILVRLPSEQRTELILQVARALGTSIAARHADLPAVRDYHEVLRGLSSEQAPRQGRLVIAPGSSASRRTPVRRRPGRPCG
jgi:tetratricopeptide (TPR) repeat protein